MKIPIVDEKDNLLYYKEFNERDPSKEITRSSGLWIFNEKGELLMAKRSKLKKYNPGLWNLSVSGANEEGETYESTIRRETEEELGITLDNLILGPKIFISHPRLYFGQCFFSKTAKDTDFILQKSEVDEIRWVSLEELKKWFSKKPEDFSSGFGYNLKALEEYDFKSKKTS